MVFGLEIGHCQHYHYYNIPLSSIISSYLCLKIDNVTLINVACNFCSKSYSENLGKSAKTCPWWIPFSRKLKTNKLIKINSTAGNFPKLTGYARNGYSLKSFFRVSLQVSKWLKLKISLKFHMRKTIAGKIKWN